MLARQNSKLMGDGSGCWATCILSEVGDELSTCPFPALLLQVLHWMAPQIQAEGSFSSPSSLSLSLSQPWATLSPQRKSGWPSTFRLCVWHSPLPPRNSTLGSPIHSLIHSFIRSFHGLIPSTSRAWRNVGAWLMAVKATPHAPGTRCRVAAAAGPQSIFWILTFPAARNQAASFRRQRGTPPTYRSPGYRTLSDEARPGIPTFSVSVPCLMSLWVSLESPRAPGDFEPGWTRLGVRGGGGGKRP